MASRPRRPGYSRRAQYGQFASYVILVAGLIVAALLLAVSIFDPSSFKSIRSAAGEVTTPVSSGLAAVGSAVASVPQGVADYFAVKQRNADLRAKLAADRAMTMRALGIIRENKRLKRLLALREGAFGTVASARLVSSTASSTRRYAVLNAGWRQGVKPGQPVQGADGLIGRILESGPDNARVLLIADAESVVPVRRVRDGLAAIAAGRGDGLIEIRAVDIADARLAPGDIFITSGVGGIYPPNIPVARVIQRGRDTAQARAFATADTLDFAIVGQSFQPLAQKTDTK